MAVPKGHDDFQNYVDHQNSQAALNALTVGLGISPEKRDIDAKATLLEKRLKAVLKAAKAEDHDALRKILATDYSSVARSQGDFSILDISTLGLTEDSQILNFLKTHGIDLNEKADLEYVRRVFSEAFQYFDKKIARSPKEVINPELKTNKPPRSYKREDDSMDYDLYNLSKEDILNVFRVSAGKGRRELIAQACGVLRIAAVIDFVERDPILSRIGQAYDRMKQMKDKKFTQTSDKRFQLKSANQIGMISPKASLELRLKKRWRILDKLLHKPSNRAEEVMDGVGMRFKTKSPYDTLMYIYNLVFNPNTAIFPLTTVIIEQVKNTAFKKEKFEEILRNPDRPEAAQELIKQLSTETVDAEEIDSDDPEAKINKHSSKYYQAIHITLDIPLKTQSGAPYYFPIELQFFDDNSWIQATRKADHTSYVEKQIATVRDRVAGNNLDSNYRKDHDSR